MNNSYGTTALLTTQSEKKKAGQAHRGGNLLSALPVLCCLQHYIEMPQYRGLNAQNGICQSLEGAAAFSTSTPPPPSLPPFLPLLLFNSVSYAEVKQGTC